MSKIAIKGHLTRGNEVIEILTMLDGSNVFEHDGNNPLSMYYVDESYKNYIICSNVDEVNDCVTFTLEEFLEKFPYKVGDKVIIKCKNKEAIVDDVFWCCDTITYYLKYDGFIEGNWRAENLQPYKEEIMEEPKELLIGFTKDSDGNLVLNTHKDYEIKEVDGKFKLILKKPQYPKTYDECCKVLFPNTIELGKVSAHGYKGELLTKFGELLICRDAYWKIVGEQMGLGELWKPDWSNAAQKKYCIVNTECNVLKWIQKTNKILVFPTKEMRDAFYENFKDLIKQCKELL